MALNAYLTLKGNTQGKISGSVVLVGREDTIKVVATSHNVVSPRDSASGLPTGKRQHKPFVITKEVDKSTPLLYNVLVKNENLTEFRLDFWQPSKSGKEVQFYSVALSGARIVGIRQEMLNNQILENKAFPVFEHVSFVYQTISWTWTNGGIFSEDVWEAPGS